MKRPRQGGAEDVSEAASAREVPSVVETMFVPKASLNHAQESIRGHLRDKDGGIELDEIDVVDEDSAEEKGAPPNTPSSFDLSSLSSDGTHAQQDEKCYNDDKTLNSSIPPTNRSYLVYDDISDEEDVEGRLAELEKRMSAFDDDRQNCRRVRLLDETYEESLALTETFKTEKSYDTVSESKEGIVKDCKDEKENAENVFELHGKRGGEWVVQNVAEDGRVGYLVDKEEHGSIEMDSMSTRANKITSQNVINIEAGAKRQISSSSSLIDVDKEPSSWRGEVDTSIESSVQGSKNNQQPTMTIKTTEQSVSSTSLGKRPKEVSCSIENFSVDATTLQNKGHNVHYLEDHLIVCQCNKPEFDDNGGSSSDNEDQAWSPHTISMDAFSTSLESGSSFMSSPIRRASPAAISTPQEDYRGDPVLTPSMLSKQQATLVLAASTATTAGASVSTSESLRPWKPSDHRHGRSRFVASSDGIVGCTHEGERVESAHAENDVLTPDFLGSVGDETKSLIDRLCIGDGGVGACKEAAAPSSKTIEELLMQLTHKADVLTKSLKRYYARMEALERENDSLRAMVRRLTGAEQSMLMCDLLKTIGSVSFSDEGETIDGGRGGCSGGRDISAQAAFVSKEKRDVGVNICSHKGARVFLSGGKEGGWKEEEEDMATAVTPAEIFGEEVNDCENLDCAKSSSPCFSSPGAKFVSGLSEDMYIQTGHYGELVRIINCELSKVVENEVRESTVDVNIEDSGVGDEINDRQT